MERQKLIIQAKKLLLDTHQDVLDSLVKESEIFEKKFAHFKNIDTTKIAPMARPVEKVTTFLREDKAIKTDTKNVIIANAPDTDGDYILVPKVVNND